MSLCGFCLFNPSSNVIWCHSLEIPDMGLASIHHSGQYLIKLTSDLAQKIVVVILFSPTGINVIHNEGIYDLFL